MLFGFVVGGAVAKEADVGRVEEIGITAQFGDGVLRVIRQAVTARSQHVQEMTLQIGAGIGQGA